MELGGFSVSLAVQDIEKSKVFYEKLGFSVFAGNQSHGYLIMKNGSTNIGLVCFRACSKTTSLLSIPAGTVMPIM
jgi:predicted lactoylglutathione lyase